MDRNPLRRATDRVETVVLAVLVVAFLVCAPFAALATGAWVHGMGQRAQRAQEGSRRQVAAVVLTVTAPQAGTDSLDWQARVRLRAPDGREVIRDISLPSSVAVGGKLQVWTDRNGDLTPAPLLDSQVAGQTTCAEALAVAATAGVLALAGALIRWSLNRRRMAAWDADWHVTGPRWTTRA